MYSKEGTGISNPDDPRNRFIKESPYYVGTRGTNDLDCGNLNKCTGLRNINTFPITSIEKKVFKSLLVILFVICVVTSVTSSVSVVFNIILDLIPVFLFGMCLPYIVIREIVLSIVNKIKN